MAALMQSNGKSGSIVLSLIQLFILLQRIRHRQRSDIESAVSKHRNKWTVPILYLAIHSAYFYRSFSNGFPGATFANLADSVLILLAAATAVVLSILETTRRSIGSSAAILVYLAFSLTRDLLEIQLGASCSNVGACYLVKFRTFVEGIWLTQILQARGFFSYHGKRYNSTPEETAGLTGQAFLYWLHPVLRQGYRARLNLNQLPEIDEQLSSMKLRGDVSEAWDSTSHFHIGRRLPYALARCLKGPLLSPFFPRLFLIFFTYLQPIFMGMVIRFVNGTSQSFLGGNSGLGLLLLAIIVYMGMAVSGAIYQTRINKLRVMVRGALTGLVHHKSLQLPLQVSRDSSALTLITSDIDSIESVGETFHETWARIMEVVIGTAFLASRIRWLALLPSVVIFACSRISAYVAKNLDSRQKSWNEATQNRVATTTSALEGIKSLKIMGMEDAVQSHILHLRSKETETSKSLRWILVAYNASANALGILAPVLTLILFAASSKRERLQADDIFTSLALLAMVTHPANMVMTLIPQAISVMSNFDRIQTFIGKPSAPDSRVASKTGGNHQITTVRDITIQFPSSSHPILRDISIDLNHGEILVCAGAVGSGKTTLAVAILGEITSTMGSISVSSKQIAYCAQDPWLPSVTIREAILGELVSLDTDWYDTVIESCGLVPDFDSFVDGDMSLIENNGMNLSGGQRQRIALARAVYSRNKILVLDDPFSALDPGVSHHIAQRLLDPQGLFRKVNATVFLISNSEYISSFADRVILLQDSRLHLQARTHPQDQKGFSSISAVSKTLSGGPSKIETSLDSKATRKPRLNNAADDLSRRNGSFAVYEYYMNAIGRTNTLLLIACTAGFSFGSTFAQYVLKWATESPSDSLSFYMSLYAAVSLIAWVATSGTVWVAQMRVATNSGAVLHAHLLGRILKAPLSYFTENDLGATLNRFGQDMNVVDKQLPPTLANLLTQIFKLTMQLILLLKVRLVMSVTLPICATCVYFIQRIYLRTSRQLRFLELETRALVFTNFLDTARGIVTIRAFGWEGKFEKENIKSLDFSQKPFYFLLCLQCWLKMTMDCIMAIFSIILIAVTVLCRDTTTGSDLGLALNLIILANTTLLRLVQSWTSLETSLGSISRLKSIQDVVRTEGGAGTTINPGLQWPLCGRLKVNDISVAYSNSSPIALRNVSLTANPGQKIIVVGRTGSGKSTMMLSLLQLLRPRQGSILLDDTDVGLLSPRAVRRQGFITVPQDNFTLPTASLRFNLDPYHTSSNQDILWILQRVNLWGKIHSTSATIANGEKSINDGIRNLLDLPMSAFLPFSAGQSQLFALSRALLRIRSAAPRKPIIILDEASSSLDSETESILRDILRHDLRDYTVVMIAHRVKGIMGAMRAGVDAIATMQDGKLQSVSLIESST